MKVKLVVSWIKYLQHTGAVESLYKTKVQYGGGPARSYWQVEPKTAMDVVKNSSAFFGKKVSRKIRSKCVKEVAITKRSTMGRCS